MQTSTLPPLVEEVRPVEISKIPPTPTNATSDNTVVGSARSSQDVEQCKVLLNDQPVPTETTVNDFAEEITEGTNVDPESSPSAEFELKEDSGRQKNISEPEAHTVNKLAVNPYSLSEAGSIRSSELLAKIGEIRPVMFSIKKATQVCPSKAQLPIDAKPVGQQQPLNSSEKKVLTAEEMKLKKKVLRKQMKSSKKGLEAGAKSPKPKSKAKCKGFKKKEAKNDGIKAGQVKNQKEGGPKAKRVPQATGEKTKKPVV